MIPRIVTLVLPYAPEERDAHDQAIAAACTLATQAGVAVDVLQLMPQAGQVTARASRPDVRWWDVVSPQAVESAPADVVAAVAHRALGHEALAEGSARLVLVPAAPMSEHVAALIAASRAGTTLGRCAELRLDGGGITAERLAFGGRLSVAVRCDAPLCCATWRAPAQVASLHPLPQDAVRQLAIDDMAVAQEPVEVLPNPDLQARLEGARLVVSGGRGIGGPEGFELLGRVAQQLDGALGGSLPAVDAGWVPVARQVGVSGKFVAPRVYFAVGISGTPQHLAGIATTTRIVALNQDAEAPIFGIADVGVVADWRELLPLVLAQLQAP